MLDRPWKVLALIIFLRKAIADHESDERNLRTSWGSYVDHHYKNPNLPIKIPEREIYQNLKLPRSLPLKVQEKSQIKKKKNRRKKIKKPKRDRKFKQNVDHNLYSLKNNDQESNEAKKNGEEYSHDEGTSKGHRTKMYYDKASSYERGQKGSYERSFGDKEQDKEDYKAEANLNDDRSEDVELKKRKNKGSKNKAYHNVFMKDEYKKDHTIFGKN